MHGLVADLRFGLRMLRRRPAVAFIAILTLALGIGSGTAMFSVVDAVLLRPLPYPDADRLVYVWSTFESSGFQEGGSALPDYRVVRDENKTLTGIGGYFVGDATVTSPDGQAEIRQIAKITETLFPVLGVAPSRGRLFNADDMVWEQHRVVVLSDHLWQERFGGDPDVVGHEVTIGGRQYKVVGVMPRGMPFFDDVPKVDLFMPLVYPPSADPGFAAGGMIAMRVPLAGPRFQDDNNGVAFFEELADRMRALPGVTAVGLGTRLPLRFGSGWGKYFWVDDWPAPSSVRDVPGASFALVDEGYFHALGEPVRSGRAFARDDDAHHPQVAIVNEAVARKYFNGADPVGRYIHMCPPKSIQADAECPRRQIVGLVADTSTETLDRPADAFVYVPYKQFDKEGWVGELTVILRGGDAAAALVPAAREQIRALDAGVPVAETVTGADLRARSVALNRFSLILLGLFAVLAATLAGVGIYSVVSYLAARRTHEMGVRLALGARPRDVQALVLAQGMRMLLAGVVVGLAGAFGLARLLRSLLYGVTPTDVWAYVAVTGALAAVAVLACWLPARRAARVDPMTSLRDAT
jgi:hypothetical protein